MNQSFDDLWRFIVTRSQGFPTVQEYHELEHVFNLMQDCGSYLEVGTAEGNSVYVLAHALRAEATIICIDLCEKHTAQPQREILDILRKEQFRINICAGDSRDPTTLHPSMKHSYDCVLIDGGHDYDTVLSDAYMYGKLATKYIFFHDVCLPEVNRAFEWYCKQRPECTAYKMINSETFGYGIMKVSE